MGHDYSLASFKCRFSSEILGSIGIFSCFIPLIIQSCCLVDHQASNFQIHPTISQEMLYSLILASWTTKYDSFASIDYCSSKGNKAELKSFSTDQDSFCIHALHNHSEAIVLSNHIFLWNSPLIKE